MNTNDHQQTLTTNHHARRGHAAHAGRAVIVAALIAVASHALAACDEASADTPPDTSLASRLAALEDKEDIRATLLAFSRAVDDSDVSALEALAPRIHDEFAMTAIDFDGSEHHFEGVDGLLSGFGPIVVDAQANLAVSAIDVDVDGTMAIASFKFINSVKPPPQLGLEVDEKVLLLAANNATFVHQDGVWQMLSLELVHSLAYPGSIEL